MSNNKLILRTANSPYNQPNPDITKNSVLSYDEVDNNFIFLKGLDVYSASSLNNNLILYKQNGDNINVPLGNISYWTAGTGYGSVALSGANSVASGVFSVAEGSGNTTSGNYSHAEGIATTASGFASHAEGYSTTASQLYSHAEGYLSTASGFVAHAEGSSVASGTNAHAEGSSVASNTFSHSEGSTTTASGNASHAEGSSSIASGNTSHAEGLLTRAFGSYSHAQGSGATASGIASHAEGASTTSIGDSSHAEGLFTTAIGSGSHAEGYMNTSNGTYTHTGGQYNIASGTNAFIHSSGSTVNGDNSTILGGSENIINSAVTGSTILGGSKITGTTSDTVYGVNFNASGSIFSGNTNLLNIFKSINSLDIYTTGTTLNGNILSFNRNDTLSAYTVNLSGISSISYWTAGTGTNAIVQRNSNSVASGTLAVAEGGNTTASGNYSHAEGNSSIASGNTSHAEGIATTASSSGAHAEGQSTIASGQYSHAEGGATRASGNTSHAEGQGTTASHDFSHAEGYYTTAGYNSHAEGATTTASGNISHAEGNLTIASGDTSHAEGYTTTASGSYSHTEGQSTTASSYSSHAEGITTTASSSGAHAEGQNTAANGVASHAEGFLTIASGDYSHSEGILTTAYGNFTHAEGGSTYAGGLCSHAEGYSTVSDGFASHVEGSHNTALLLYSDNSSVGGEYNISSGYTAFIHSSGSTVIGNYSSILGGKGHRINANVTGSTILGGSFITGVTSDTVYGVNFNARNGITGVTISATTYLNLPTTGTLTFMFISGASSISTYRQAVPLSQYISAGVSVSSTTVTTTPTILGVFASNVGQPNLTVIPSGTFLVHYDTQKNAGSNNYYTYAELYKRSSGGTETLLSTTDNSSQSAVNTILNINASGLLSSNTLLDISDRLVVKIYGVMVSSSATIDLRIDDSTNSRLELPYASGSIFDIYTTGATLNSTTLQFRRNDNQLYSVNLSSVISNLWSGGSGSGSVALSGGSSTASGQLSVAEGFQNTASGQYSHAEGYQTKATDQYAHAEGWTTSAGYISHAEGYNSTASLLSHAEGYGCTSYDFGAHAEGRGCYAGAQGAHAEGYGTTAAGQGSHAEGGSTYAGVSYAHAEGSYTYAAGANSHVEGVYNTSVYLAGDNSSVGGQRNLASGNTAFIHSSGSTVMGDYSSILGGKGHTINANVTGSTILGGSYITGTTSDTTYVPALNIKTVGAGPGTITLAVDANGNVVNLASDISLKENILTLNDSLSKVNQLRGVTYTWKDTNAGGTQTNIGFIAQEVELVVPELTFENNGIKGVKYADTVALLVEAIKELTNEVNDLKQQLKNK
jgi:hypothetical protein